MSSKSEKVVPVTVVVSQETAGSESQEQVNQGDDRISRLGSGQQEQGDMKNEEIIGSNTEWERERERKNWQLSRIRSSLRIFCDIDAT